MLFNSVLIGLFTSVALAAESTAPSSSNGDPHLAYGYFGINGPFYWSNINPTCAGLIQSPISIDSVGDDFAKTLKGILRNPNGQFPEIAWPNTPGDLYNYGDTYKFMPSSQTGTFDRREAGVFKLIQWHHHCPSEHRVNGIAYACEIHFVHQGPHGELAVIGAFVDLGESTSPFITAFMNAGKPLADHAKVTFTPDYAPVVSAIKNSARFYRYQGSLTTPPCSEGVQWLVASQPVFTITQTDLKALKAVFGYNARNTQPLSDPYDAAWAVKRMSNYFPDGGAVAPVVASGH